MSTTDPQPTRNDRLRGAGGALAKGTGETLGGFRDFLLRGNLVELATAVIIGTAFTAVVTAFTKILTEVIGKFGHVPDFTGVQIWGFSIGNFINAVLTFILVAAVLYFLVITPYNRARALNSQKEEAEPAVTSEDLLTEIRDILRQQTAGTTGAGTAEPTRPIE